MVRRRKKIPILTDGDAVLSMPMFVETDDLGEYWLTPDQINAMKVMRTLVQFSAEGNNQVLPGARLVKRSKVSSPKPTAVEATSEPMRSFSILSTAWLVAGRA